jgi:hypothetical protein
MSSKQKPTKVTKDDIELAQELERITTIKGLLDDFRVELKGAFESLAEVAHTGNNPVTTYLEIFNTQDALESSLQFLQAQLLQELGQVDEEDAHALAEPQTEDIESASLPEAPEIDEALGPDPEKGGN